MCSKTKLQFAVSCKKIKSEEFIIGWELSITKSHLAFRIHYGIAYHAIP